MSNLPAFKIPLHDHRTNHDCCPRLYRRALYNTLLALKPKHCFEIGSYTFQSSAVFSDFFKEQSLDGKLITADIAKHTKSDPPDNVYQVMFYPYEDPLPEHGQIDVYYSKYMDVINKDLSLELNSLKLFEIMSTYNIRNFDFTFIDGSHFSKSFLSDLYLAQLTTSKNGWILIDDVYAEHYEQSKIFNELCRHNKFYIYDDWEINPGMALIQNKNLVVK